MYTKVSNTLMLLSIIITIYNVEKYIKETLDSIYTQINNINDIEVIMVNDGSKDNSIKVAEKYYNKYKSYTQIIHQENLGLSCARNTGLAAAKGKYIWFVDSDDTINKNSICQITKYIKEYNADILAFDILRINEKNNKTKIHSIFYKKYNYRLYNMVLNKYHIVSIIRETPVQKFIFKHDLLKKNNLTFFPGILHEDNEFMIRCIYHAESIVPIRYAPYRYLIRNSGSITSSKNPKRIKDLLRIIDILKTYRDNHANLSKEKAFFDYYRFITIHRLLKNKLFKEYKSHIGYNYKLYHNTIIEGLIASIKLRLWTSVFRCIIDLYKNRYN